MTPILRIEDLSKSFGGVKALKTVSLDVGHNEILGLIGPNGAGKTTLFNCVCGVFPPESGRVLLKNKDITRQPTHRIAHLGIGRTFQIVKPFKNLSLERNILASLCKDRTKGLSPIMFGTGLKKHRQEVLRLLNLVGLEEYIDQTPMTLPLGHQKRMEISRALALHPKLLMLDEPFAGLSQEDITPLLQVIKNLRSEGLSILLIEHNIPYVMELCDRLVVLNFGEVLCEGTCEDVQSDSRVIEAYLGS
ncbi:MAG: ABC transporter ATP-binding protein [Desulfobacterales bacterium]|nr:ABC transporter ATP-binding protein [Desulfobacterales bacterium]